jgi:uncharacterized 2Fe-2S/4Fe-4S cluster protein (DUF4445 family)
VAATPLYAAQNEKGSPHRNNETALYVDIGTNGEMAFGHAGRLWCCATAAGPAFEGACITHGTGGVEGAVSGYTEADGYSTIGDKPAVGICGSGLVDIAAHLVRTGIVDSTGYMEKDFVVVPAGRAAQKADIVITPQDIRQVQLAKAAIAAGVRVLMDEAGVAPDRVSTLYLGGGFGSYLDVESSAVIGLIPPSLKDRVVATGNIAGRGALHALLSESFAGIVDAVADRMEYVELSTHTGFMMAYIEEMAFGR